MSDLITFFESRTQLYSNAVRLKEFNDLHKISLRKYPAQYIERIYDRNGDWTTQLHYWASKGIDEILNIPTIFLTTKNDMGESVAHKYLFYCLGENNDGMIYYDKIKKLLNVKMVYTEIIAGKEVEKNLIDCVDLNNMDIIDYLFDYATGSGFYQGNECDEELIQMIKSFNETKKES